MSENGEEESKTCHVRMPKRCPVCGTEQVLCRIVRPGNGSIMAFLVCEECLATIGLPYEENLKKRVNQTLYHLVITVKKRDGYRCRICGCEEKTMLVVHHIIPVSHDKKQMYNANNMVTLCKKCHMKVHEEPGEAAE